jgi:hypothetical protein
MEKITTSSELSKELKENGFKQNSFFWWTNELDSESGGFINELINIHAFEYDKLNDISAPTAEELLEELPEIVWKKEKIYKIPYRLIIHKGEKYYVNYEADKSLHKGFLEEKLCNALAKMWLYLKKKGLLK